MMTTGAFKDCGKPHVAACAFYFPTSPCGTKSITTATTTTPTTTVPKTKKEQVTAIIKDIRSYFSGTAMSEDSLVVLDVGFDNLIATEDINGTQAIFEKATSMYDSGNYKTMNDVVKDNEFTSLIANYNVDIYALIKSIHNPFIFEEGTPTLDFDVVLAALNLTANMIKTWSDFMEKNYKVMDGITQKGKIAKEGKCKGWLTAYGTLNAYKFMQEESVAAAFKTYSSNNEKNATDLLDFIKSAAADDEKAGAALMDLRNMMLMDVDFTYTAKNGFTSKAPYTSGPNVMAKLSGAHVVLRVTVCSSDSDTLEEFKISQDGGNCDTHVRLADSCWQSTQIFRTDRSVELSLASSEPSGNAVTTTTSTTTPTCLTPLNDTTVKPAIVDCLAKDAVKGDCASSTYGAIADWCVRNVTSFAGMFDTARTFNGDITKWDTSSGTSFYEMFYEAKAFNGDITKWNTSSGTSFAGMFIEANAFNQPIAEWDTSSGTSFAGMFYDADVFNADITEWNTSSGIWFSNMFHYATAFNQPIAEWDTSSGTTFADMFSYATAFNQPIAEWDTASGTSFTNMFKGATKMLGAHNKCAADSGPSACNGQKQYMAH